MVLAYGESMLRKNESQNVEFKESWHDKYLEWVCGFANAHGGTIYIGVDDDGNVIGLSDTKKLLEDIPNKIRNHLGIMAEVNLKEDDQKYYLEIIVPPYDVAVSLRGHYYYRSGSTKTEYTGAALNELLLKKAGKTWDNAIEPLANIDDIDVLSLNRFITEAEGKGRLPDVGGLTPFQILEKLRLADEKGIKRAAIVLFGKDPGKFYPNLTVKLGRFGVDDADLRFQENEEGNLVYLLHEVPNQLNRKFLIKSIEFEGLQRIEKGEYPVAALREMLLNALVHRNYMGSMTQIRVYDHKISIWNEGILPVGMSLDALKRQHPSRPRNPIIADVCFKAGYIDSWGRGTIKIIDACKEAGLPEAQMNEEDGGFLVTLFKTGVESRVESGVESGVELDMASKVLHFLSQEPLSKSQIAVKLGRDKPTRYLNELMNKLLSDGVVEYTIPDKPNSRLQKYRLRKN